VGFFKQMKDMKNMVHEAPEMVAMANEMNANAQAAAAAQQAAAEQALAAAQAGATNPTVAQPGAIGIDPGGDLSPINGVSLELYAEISRSFAEVGYDQSKGPELAARKGVAAADWEAAMAGWNARMQSNPAVAKQFNSLYTGR
jgi:hypothetical protein